MQDDPIKHTNAWIAGIVIIAMVTASAMTAVIYSIMTRIHPGTPLWMAVAISLPVIAPGLGFYAVIIANIANSRQRMRDDG